MNNLIYFFDQIRFRYYYLRMLQEVLPAFALDCYMRVIGRKPM